jgi:uncharacterized membrane protein
MYFLKKITFALSLFIFILSSLSIQDFFTRPYQDGLLLLPQIRASIVLGNMINFRQGDYGVDKQIIKTAFAHKFNHFETAEK